MPAVDVTFEPPLLDALLRSDFLRRSKKCRLNHTRIGSAIQPSALLGIFYPVCAGSLGNQLLSSFTGHRLLGADTRLFDAGFDA